MLDVGYFNSLVCRLANPAGFDAVARWQAWLRRCSDEVRWAHVALEPFYL